MLVSPTAQVYEHVEIDQAGAPIVAGTTMTELDVDMKRRFQYAEQARLEVETTQLNSAHREIGSFGGGFKHDSERSNSRFLENTSLAARIKPSILSPLYGALGHLNGSVASTEDLDAALREMWLAWDKDAIASTDR